MSDIAEEMQKIVRLGGNTYSSYEVFNIIWKAANEIKRLRTLIHAAPDLLLALKAMLSSDRQAVFGSTELINQAWRAIDKAEGREK